MKQNITHKQLEELGIDRHKLNEWWLDRWKKLKYPKYGPPWLTIGEMIEFLQDKNPGELQLVLELDGKSEDLCDSLWESVKETLREGGK